MAIEHTIKATASNIATDIASEISAKPNLLYEKILPDRKSVLKLIEVVNRTIMPGKIYQIEFTDGNILIPIPRYCEKYTEKEIKELYVSIRSRADVERLMKKEEQDYRGK